VDPCKIKCVLFLGEKKFSKIMKCVKHNNPNGFRLFLLVYYHKWSFTSFLFLLQSTGSFWYHLKNFIIVIQLLGPKFPVSQDGYPRLPNHQWWVWTLSRNCLNCHIVIQHQHHLLRFKKSLFKTENIVTLKMTSKRNILGQKKVFENLFSKKFSKISFQLSHSHSAPASSS
jgi:hypothetical protein